MSSILDALNKLESERLENDNEAMVAQAQAVDEDTAARELMGGRFIGERVTIRLRPFTLMVTLIVIAVGFGAASIAAFIWLTGDGGAPLDSGRSVRVAAMPPANPSPSAAEFIADEEVREPLREPSLPEPEPDPPQESSLARNTPVENETPPNSQPPSAPVASPAPIEAPEPEPEPAPARAAPVPVNDLNPQELPRLSVSERQEYGLEPFNLNMVLPADEARPRALAIINYGKVYVGNRIGDSQAQLIRVDADGVVIQILSTGQRYFEEF